MNTDNKNTVRTSDCRTTIRQNDCTHGSPLKHTNIKITMNIITQAGKFRLKFKKLESHVSKRSDLDLTVFILFGGK